MAEAPYKPMRLDYEIEKLRDEFGNAPPGKEFLRGFRAAAEYLGKNPYKLDPNFSAIGAGVYAKGLMGRADELQAWGEGRSEKNV